MSPNGHDEYESLPKWESKIFKDLQRDADARDQGLLRLLTRLLNYTPSRKLDFSKHVESLWLPYQRDRKSTASSTKSEEFRSKS